MKNKLLYLTLFFFGLAGIIIVSCDKISPPYMNVTDVSDCPVPDFPQITGTYKTVLLEEFTGHLCINCPEAAHYIHQIKQKLGDSVIMLAIHAGGYAVPQPGDYDLDLRTTDLGEDYYTHFSIPANPRAMFNREYINSQRTFGNPSTWENLVNQARNKAPQAFIQIINNYDENTRKLCTHVKTTFLENYPATTKLVVLIKEDSIVGFQKNNNATYGPVPDIPNYVFNDVLRASFNSAYGEILNSSAIAKDSAIVRSFKKILPSNWNDKHCKVVAYVYDSDTEVILQVAEKEVY